MTSSRCTVVRAMGCCMCSILSVKNEIGHYHIHNYNKCI